MRIVLLGPPGSGKAELSKKIADAYRIPIVTQAGVVDAVAAEPGELGRLAADARDASRVSDELLLALLRIQLPKMDLSKGYLLVDMPRDSGQADVLDSMLDELGQPIDLVIKLDVDMDELMERLVGRIRCDNCGAEYNLYVNPPMVEGVCDECGARCRRRPDDYEETISNRLRVYESQMGPLLQYYGQAEKLHRFDATGDLAPVWWSMKELIDATPSPEVEAAPKVEAESESSGTEPKATKASAAKSKTGKAGKKKVIAKAGEAGKKVAKKASAKKKTSAKTDKKAMKKAAAPARKKAKKKAASKKAVAKKVSAKKVVKKAASKKAVAKKAAKKKVASKKVVSKKVASKKAIAKPASKKVVRKAAKRTVSKKVTSKKAVAKKVVAKKAAKKKAVPKKAARKKVVAKATAKKTAKKKTSRRSGR